MEININSFRKSNEINERIALVYGFDSAGWSNFKVNQRTIQQGLSQAQRNNTHSNTTPHSNLSPHSNGNYHSDRSPHSDSTTYSDRHRDTDRHSDYAPHSDGTRHADFSRTSHSNGHSDRHSDKSVSRHTDYHSDGSPDRHSDSESHYDKYNHRNTSPHSDYTYETSSHRDTSPHSDNLPHSNSYTHSNTNPHSNVGFDHTNFIPSTPEFFDHVNGEKVKGNITLAIYSYDNNNRIAGTQTAAAKEVYYDLQIRKVRNLDGTANVSAWRTLINNTKEASYDNGITFDLNTMSPLDAAVTTASVVTSAVAKTNEGFYQVRAVARNANQSGNGVGPITYESTEKVIELKIQQNTVVTASVDNTTEIINFWFGEAGAYTTTGPVRKSYGNGMYAGTYDDTNAKNNGILVKISMTDIDTPQYQTGKAKLLDRGTGALIATTDVYWSQTSALGATKVQSGGVAKTGYAYFDESSFPADTVNRNCVIEIEIRDYEDSGLTKPTGDVVTFRTFTSTGGSQLNVQIDNKKPTLVNSTLGSSPTNYLKSDTLTISPADTGGTGVYKTYYRYIEKWDNGDGPLSAWIEYTAPVIFNAPDGRSGQVVVETKTVDNANNESPISTVNIYLDNKRPTGTISINDDSIPDTSKYTIPQTVTLALTATDGVSSGGISQMRFRNENGAWTDWETYNTSKVWTLSAGNGEKRVSVQYRDKTLNESDVYEDTIIWDDVVPTGTIEINNGALYTMSKDVNLNLTSADNFSGVEFMRFRNEAGGWSAWEPVTTSKAWTLSDVNGTKTVGVQYKDKAGNMSAEYTDTIMWDDVIPTGSIVLKDKFDDDTINTQHQNVDIDLTSADDTSGVESMRFRNESGGWSAWETVASTKNWNLSANNGVKRVGVQFRDKAGNISLEYTDEIIWDDTEPTAEIIIDQPNKWKNDTYRVTVNTADLGGSGILTRRYMVTQSEIAPSIATMKASGTVIAADSIQFDVTDSGINYIYVYIEDNAGNVVQASDLKFTNTIQNSMIMDKVKINTSIEATSLLVDVSDELDMVEVTPEIIINGRKTYVIENTEFASKFNLIVTDNDINDSDPNGVNDAIDIELVVTNHGTGEEVKRINKENVQPSIVNIGTFTDTNQIWYLNDDLGEDFKDWKDGIYELTVTITDDKLVSSDTSENEEDVSTSTQTIYLLIKREAPPIPKFTVVNRGEYKGVTVEYPEDNVFSMYPQLTDKYTHEFKKGVDVYRNYTGEIEVRTETSIIARNTDFAGNQSVNMININIDGLDTEVVDFDGANAGGDGQTDSITKTDGNGKVVIEENRATTNYFINIRKDGDDKLNTDVFRFLE